MICKIYIISLLSLLLVCPSVTTLAANDLSELEKRVSKCNETWCISVASPPSPWPSPLKVTTIAVEEHPAIVIEIPTGFVRIRRTDTFLMFIYPEKKILTLEELSRDAFPELRENTKNSRMTMADAVHATFTKTVKDKTPKRREDKLFWYWAMFFKSAFFEKDTPVITGKKGHLSAYYLTSTWNGKSVVNTAVIVNDSSPSYALKLGSANMTFEEFKSIIGTIKEKELTKR